MTVLARSEKPPGQLRRRPWLTEPGEPLVLAGDPVANCLRYGLAARDFGLGTDRLVTSRLVSVPMPLYVPGSDPRERWPDIRPESLWLPLLWLPPHLADTSTQVSDGDGGQRDMEVDEWMLRAAIDLSLSGLYSEADGTWLDVAALGGVDLTTPEGVERARRWLDGGADPAFDDFDLGSLIADSTQGAWATAMAVELAVDLRPYSWALGSDSLLEVLDSLPEEVSKFGMDTPSLLSVLGVVAQVGAAWVIDIPDQDASPQLLSIAEMLAAIDPATPPQAVLDGPVEELVDILLAVRDRFWPRVDAAVNGVNGNAPEADPWTEGWS